MAKGVLYNSITAPGLELLSYKKIFKNIFLLLMFFLLAIVVWRFSLLVNTVSTILQGKNTYEMTSPGISDQGHTVLSSYDPVSEPSPIGHYETINETIARLKKDVVLSATMLREAGKKSAYFQIEGMDDREFYINTQLMDGFIITEITENHVLLKNQTGPESFVLKIRQANDQELLAQSALSAVTQNQLNASYKEPVYQAEAGYVSDINNSLDSVDPGSVEMTENNLAQDMDFYTPVD